VSAHEEVSGGSGVAAVWKNFEVGIVRRMGAGYSGERARVGCHRRAIYCLTAGRHVPRHTPAGDERHIGM